MKQTKQTNRSLMRDRNHLQFKATKRRQQKQWLKKLTAKQKTLKILAQIT